MLPSPVERAATYAQQMVVGWMLTSLRKYVMIAIFILSVKCGYPKLQRNKAPIWYVCIWTLAEELQRIFELAQLASMTSDSTLKWKSSSNFTNSTGL